MSNPSIPKNRRERKGQAIAAIRDQIYEVRRNALYLVMSQTYTSEAYEVLAVGPHWKCTCTDYRKHHQTCKHIYAVLAILDADAELSQWEAQPRYNPEHTVDHIETLMGRPHLTEDEMEHLHILRNTAELSAVSFALQYFWIGFRPAELLDDLQCFGLETPASIAVKTPTAWKWRPLQGTIDTVREYILENHLRVGLAAVEPYSRRLGRLGDATYNVFLVSQSA